MLSGVLPGVVIAQRGRIAERIAASCRRLGVTTWLVCEREPAVGADVDACDHVVLVGKTGDPDAHAQALADAARQVGAAAVHPGLLGEAPPAWLGALQATDLPVLACSALPTAEGLASLAAELGLPLAASATLNRPRRLQVPLVLYGKHEAQMLPDVQSLPAPQGSLPWLLESPASALNLSQYGERLRDRLLSAAGKLAAAIGGTGLLTLCFDVDASDQLFLVQATAGLQPLHSLSEMMLGIDLVELQLRAASGEPPTDLPATQPGGCAVLANLCALQPLPESEPEPAGKWPQPLPGRLRVELPDGETALLGRLIASAPIRHRALLLLDRALTAVELPPATNLAALRALLADEAFRAGQYDSSAA